MTKLTEPPEGIACPGKTECPRGRLSMRTRGHWDDPCYGRRAVLGLALATLAVGPARAAEEDDAAKPPPRRTIALCF